MVAIDGVDLKKDLGIDVLLAVELPVAPDTRDKTLEIPNKHGAYDLGAYMQPVPHAIPIHIKDKDMLAIQRKAKELTRLLLDDWGRPKTVKLTYDLETNRYHNVRYTGSLDIARQAVKGELTLPFTNYDAWHYDVNLTNDINMDSTTVTADDDYDINTVSVTDEQITANTTVQAFSNGYAIRPKLLINGTGQNVTFTVNGKSFSLKDFTNASFTINGKDYTVLKDGANGFTEKIGRDFLELMPGLNDITITGDNMDFTLTIEFRDQYM